MGGLGKQIAYRYLRFTRGRCQPTLREKLEKGWEMRRSGRPPPQSVRMHSSFAHKTGKRDPVAAVCNANVCTSRARAQDIFGRKAQKNPSKPGRFAEASSSRCFRACDEKPPDNAHA